MNNAIKLHEVRDNIYGIINAIAAKKKTRWEIFMRGQKVAVIIDPDELERIEDENEIMRDLIDDLRCSSNSLREIDLSDSAAAMIDGAEPKTKRILKDALNVLAMDPRNLSSSYLRLSGGHRLRVGKWRILYRIKKDNNIFVERIILRKNAYR